MSLAGKLQNAYEKVHKKLGMQDGDITFRKVQTSQSTEFGLPYAASSHSEVVISEGVKVSRLKAYEVDPAGLFQVNDLKLIIPASLINENQVDGSKLIYNGKTHSIKSFKPSNIYSGEAINWEIIARVES